MEATNDEIAPLLFPSNNRQSRPEQNSQWRFTLAVYLIIFSAGLERLAFYSLAGNLTFFLGSHLIGWHFPHTVTATLIFLGVSYISALIFSYVSDGKLGRANTIIIGFLFYSIGYAFMVLFANADIHKEWCPKSKNHTETSHMNFLDQICVQYILPSLVMTATGAGAVQANMAVFGAEQVRGQHTWTRYFDMYYAAANTGGLIAFGAIAYLQINTNYFIGYLVPASLLLLSFILFLTGYHFYVQRKNPNPLLHHFVPVLFNAFQTWQNHPRDRLENHETSSLNAGSQSSWSFIDYARIGNHGNYVDSIIDDMKSLRRIILVFLLLMPYWLLYIQVETTFIVQGAHMRLPTTFEEMPVVWLSLGNQIIIIVTIIFLNAFVYKRLQAGGRSFSIRSRILMGLIPASLAMCMAGTVEFFRQEINKTQNFTQIIGDKHYLAANMSVFFQFPQYFGIGLSEVLTSVASLEFAYLAAPRSAQSLIMSLRFCSTGLSSFFGSGIVALFSIENDVDTLKFTEDYHNDPRYYIYFFALAGLQVVFILILFGCDRKYQLLQTPNLHLHRRHWQTSTSTSTSMETS